jgi:hypothetical protein
MADPVVTPGQDHRAGQAGHGRVLGGQLSLLIQLTCQLHRGVRRGLRIGEHLARQGDELGEQTVRQMPLEHVAGEQGQHLQGKQFMHHVLVH